ncbi:cobyrinic acid a,c-diamide synthase [Clostridium tertium]|uniref:cobyrinic acid a,c-diamide synthase n=1 Tax=Clostridium TaxID=1485 RepID=UPI00232E0BC7|nr:MULTISPECIES: cobyrinic acid a,c-diamide synthase [Clostridium]MDB1922104.1 cobyrinic acid a,c-diamide synthase [Clostridium tertium]MDB1926507.1 cobyrinic acid a,c-diamide synthase [Clostridium tertium]MDB1929684.1 cobyrinic acid a,c-diamide synthase [Clostridium tertium]MDU3548769.1 cobyrinic acid a,c-diamide synthase [Clostridium sp.]MDU4737273.1 cobyrinic acid a,c-diamide synthase [Clostridium sp.]
MLCNIIEVLDGDFCINYGELQKCSSCNGCNLNCNIYESKNSRLSEIENIDISSK